MSATGYTSEDLRKDRDPWWRRALGSLRRMAVDLSDGASWKVRGYQILSETFRAEVFSGVGFASRPRPKANAETIVAFVGGAAHPCIVATRDEGLRRDMVGNLKPDETAIYNSTATIIIKSDGTVEIRTRTGTAKRLATVDDLEALKEAIETATPATDNTGAGLQASIVTNLLNWPIGTTVLRGE